MSEFVGFDHHFTYTAQAVDLVSKVPVGLRLLKALRASSRTQGAYRKLVGYRRPFTSLAEAEAAIAAYAQGGHGNPLYLKELLRLNDKARPSDYAALFHIGRLRQNISRIYDIGGSVGNLFYCYDRYLSFPPDFIWQVNDLPETMKYGAELAEKKSAGQLKFTGDWQAASGADLLIASGSLHYFETPLPQMLAGLASMPRYIMVNRTPLTEGPTYVTVQDAGYMRVPCIVYNRPELIDALQGLGYRLADQWQATELSLRVPGHPEHTIHAYSGFLLERQ